MDLLKFWRSILAAKRFVISRLAALLLIPTSLCE